MVIKRMNEVSFSRNNAVTPSLGIGLCHATVQSLRVN